MNTQEQQTQNIQSQEQKNRNPKYSKICTQIIPQKSIVHKHQPKFEWFFFFLSFFMFLSRADLGLEQIQWCRFWVWSRSRFGLKKLPILFFATSFISFEPKLKMVAIAASISSTSLFFPTLSFGLKLTTLSFTSPPIPIPRESNRYETLHSSPTHRRQRDVAPPHTSSKVRRPPTLRRQSDEFSPFSFLL